MLASVLVVFASGSAYGEDSQGRSLARLWKDYEKALNADKVKDQVKILEKIKKEASASQLWLDWYDAAEKYVQVRLSSNWKLRETLEKQFRSEVDAIDSPLPGFCYRLDRKSLKEAEDFAGSNSEKLLASRNSKFYSRLSDWPKYAPVLAEVIDNDLDFALWSLVLRGSEGGSLVRLETRVKGNYPQEALLEYKKIQNLNSDERKSSLEDFASKHAGSAVALLAQEDLLSLRKSDLDAAKTSGSADYLGLKADCEAFRKLAGTYKGIDKKIADCCVLPQALVKELESSDIFLSTEGHTLNVALRNLASAKVTVRPENSKETVFSAVLENKNRSFYAADTIVCSIPVLTDGEYMVECSSGKVSKSMGYGHYSLSLSCREDADGVAVYVADYMTGEPLRTADILLYDRNGKLLKERRGMPLQEGFTYLDEEFSLLSGDGYSRYELRAEANAADGRKLLSHNLHRYVGPLRTGRTGGLDQAVILTDRSAFRSGETVNVKAIAFEGGGTWKTFPKGRSLTLSLTGPDGKELASKKVLTDDFGAAAASFEFAGKSKNGLFILTLKDGKTTLASKSVRVDDFVLPTFDLVWDEDNEMHLPGDMLTVSGKISSYSGRSLSSAKVEYSVSGSSQTASGTVVPSSDGSFSITFPTEQKLSWGFYRIVVKITDSTGETLEFSTSRTASDYLHLLVDLENAAEGRFSLADKGGVSCVLLSEPEAKFRVEIAPHQGLNVAWTLCGQDGKRLSGGECAGSSLQKIDFGALPEGLYFFRVEAKVPNFAGKTLSSERELAVLKISDSTTALPAEVRGLFRIPSGDGISLQFGHGEGPVWALAELFGAGNKLLESKLVRLSGAKDASAVTVSFENNPAWSDELQLNVLYFRDGKTYSYSRTIRRNVLDYSLPLAFSRFTDKTAPGAKTFLEISSVPGTQCALTVFDKASEAISSNQWAVFRPFSFPEVSVKYNSAPGSVGGDHRIYVRGMQKNMAFGMRAPASAELMSADAVVEESATVAYGKVDAGSVQPRKNFAATLAWEPFLRFGEDGLASVEFTAGDRLSTYCVQLFAHDRDMRNSVLRKEMMVTIPVQLALDTPQFLFSGDSLVLRPSVSNISSEPVSGSLSVSLFGGRDYAGGAPLLSLIENLTVPVSGEAGAGFAFAVPEIKELGILVRFVPDGVNGDAMFVSVPVLKPVQTLTEARSALLKPRMDRDSLIAALRSSFKNFDASSATVQEISILDMVKAALPTQVQPSSDNVVSLSQALYAAALAKSLGADCSFDEAAALEKLLACLCSDGGFSWFAGMKSSPVLTAVLLERVAAMRGRGLAVPETLASAVPDAVRYLDSEQFKLQEGRWWWYGRLSDEQYMRVRSLFPEVGFNVSKSDAVRVKAFKKAAKSYLVPGKVRGMNGQILAKARRVSTLKALTSSKDGLALAKAWGVNFAAGKRLSASLHKDLESLVEYAQPHTSGGYYFPNAVLPFRGLLESELYAHSLLCELLSDASDIPGAGEIAEGVRLWMMIQKETQQWGNDPAFIEAIASVLDGSEATLSTKVLVLSVLGELPLVDVKASGNGLTVSRNYFKLSADGKRTPLSEGDVLHIGDKVTAVYSVSNDENRSFVRLTAPRPASLRPVQQLSGHFAWNAYRNVLKDRTEFWYDVYPEEKTTVEESFFVTAEGVFQTPAVEIESTYAPHYRANGVADAVSVRE